MLLGGAGVRLLTRKGEPCRGSHAHAMIGSQMPCAAVPLGSGYALSWQPGYEEQLRMGAACAP